MGLLKRSVGDYLFFGSLTIFVSLTFTANMPSIVTVLLPLSYVALTLLAMAFVFRLRQYTANEVLVICALGAISIYQFVCNGNNSLLKLTLLLAAMKGISFRECIKYDLVLRVIWTVVLIASSYMGLAEDIVLFDSARGVRHSLGFSNPNQLGMAFLVMCLEALCLMDFKLKTFPAIALVASAAWVDTVSGSRSASMFIFLALALSAANTFWPGQVQKSTLLRRWCGYVAPVLFVLTWAVVYFYQQGSSWAVLLNNLLTNRLGHIDTYTRLISPQLLGSNLSSVGLTLDTMYAYLVYGYGIVITVIYLIAQPLLVRNLWKRGEQGLALVLLVLSLYGLSERLWLCVEYNGLMLVFGTVLYGRKYLFNTSESPGMRRETMSPRGLTENRVTSD